MHDSRATSGDLRGRFVYGRRGRLDLYPADESEGFADRCRARSVLASFTIHNATLTTRVKSRTNYGFWNRRRSFFFLSHLHYDSHFRSNFIKHRSYSIHISLQKLQELLLIREYHSSNIERSGFSRSNFSDQGGRKLRHVFAV